MDEERPLDAFFPELTELDDPYEATTEAPGLDPSVLEVELEGGWSWTMALWHELATPRETAQQLRKAVEATLLREMSTPPGYGGAEGRAFLGIHLLVFEPMDAQTCAALEALGFHQGPYKPQEFSARVQRFQDGARAGSWRVASHPETVWFSEFARPAATMGRVLQRVHEDVVERLGAALWGSEPGMPSKALADALSAHMGAQITPDRDGLHMLDMTLVERTAGKIRWLSPMILQGIADFVGIVLTTTKQYTVQWGVSESDRRGAYLPPVLRARRRATSRELAVGRELVRLTMMPIASEEDAVLLSDWLDEVSS
ncbi:MAG: hypothetical protein AAGI01_05680 [Myxococcota bacterium]